MGAVDATQASIRVKAGENEMEQSVEKIIERNLLEVFNARDAGSRRAAASAS